MKRVSIVGRSSRFARESFYRHCLALPAAMVLLTAPARGGAQALPLSGFVEVGHFQYFRAASTGQSRNEQLHLQLGARLPFGERLRIQGAGEIRGTYSGQIRGRAYVNELFVDLLLGRLEVRVGKQVIPWGTADVFNPTDNLTPSDFTDPLDTDDRRLGGFAARAQLSAGRVQLEAVLIPVFTASRLPAAGSRWYPPLATSMPDPLNSGRNVALTYDTPAPRTPESTLANAQYAARASTTLRGWDVSLSYFDGWDDLPTTEQQAAFIDSMRAHVTILEVYARRRAIGGDLATTFGRYTVRAEAAYLMLDALGAPNHYYYVVGLERSFGDPMGTGSTTVVGEWIQELAPGEFKPSPHNLDHIFHKTLAVRLQHSATSDLEASAEGLYDFVTKGYYVHPGASYRLFDGLRLEVSADVLGGNKDSFFGGFARNQRLRVELRYSF